MTSTDSPKSIIQRKIVDERSDAPVPEPGDLENFLPWICGQMTLGIDLMINTTVLEDYISIVASDRTSKQVRTGKSRAKLPSSVDLMDTTEVKAPDSATEEPSDQNIFKNQLRMTLVYEHQTVVGLKFQKNRIIPRQIFQILILIVNFHKNITSVTINRGLNAVTLYELTKLLSLSKITDVCLDNCYIKEGNYYLLLEKPSCLKNLSLSRCSIDDIVVGLIASQLAHPQPGSSTLVVLNLSTNRITDIGMKSIGNALRSNEKLAYLNLADNMISDEGLAYLLDSCLEFLLTDEEVAASRRRHVMYMKSKNEMIGKIMKELKVSDWDRKQLIKKRSRIASTVSASKKSKVFEKESSVKNLDGEPGGFDPYLYERASGMAHTQLGSFRDPFCRDNIIAKGSLLFSCGNKTLCNLNVAYNNLSFNSVQKLLDVVMYQKSMDRRPVGLLNACLDGNMLPDSCQEMSEIDNLLELGLMTVSRRSGVGQSAKKKPVRIR